MLLLVVLLLLERYGRCCRCRCRRLCLLVMVWCLYWNNIARYAQLFEGLDDLLVHFARGRRTDLLL